MAYWAWKDISAVTYNSQDLKGFVAGGFNVSGHAVLDDFKPAGSAWPTPLDTGGRSVDPITIPFKYDGSATGPCVKAALGTSATMTLTHATGQSVSGTFIVSDFDFGETPEGVATYNPVFTPSGTITIDFTE